MAAVPAGSLGRLGAFAELDELDVTGRRVGLKALVTAPGLVYHRICDDKSTRTFVDLLGDYQGWVVADALGTHQAGARECRGLRLAACWAHVLRRFRDAVVDLPEAQLMLAWIHDLYEIDARAGDMTERKRLRSRESRAVTEKMKLWMQDVTALKTTASAAPFATRSASGDG